MNSTTAPREGTPEKCRRFQFDLRAMLALTALTAWMFGLIGVGGIFAFFMLACMALVEAGCTQGANVLRVFVRNLFAFFVCSLVFGAVGFGVMYGSSPMRLLETDQFLFAPLFTSVEPLSFEEYDPSNVEHRARMRAADLRGAFCGGIIVCAIAVCIAHRVLARRARLGGYLLFWIVVSGLIYPVLGSWTWQDPVVAKEAGWLMAIGFAHPFSLPLLAALSVAGWAPLAGALVLKSRSDPEDRRLGLVSSHCHHVLVSLGLGLPWLVIVGLSFLLWVTTRALGPQRAVDAYVGLAFTAAGVVGLAAALASSLIWRKRFHLPLELSGGFGGLLAVMSGDMLMGPVWAVVVGLVAGGLVVLATWVFEMLRVDDAGGAVAVFGACSAWGTLNLPLFPARQAVGGTTFILCGGSLPLQLLGVAVCFVWVFLFSAAVLLLIRRFTTVPTAEDETAGQSVDLPVNDS